MGFMGAAKQHRGPETETAAIEVSVNVLRFNNLRNDPGGFRTHDLRIKSPLLYQLSYRVLMAFKIQRTVHRVSRSRAARPMVWEGLLMVCFPDVRKASG